MTKYVLSIVVDNNPNVMARVSSMFARRRFNMTSVTAAQTSDPNVSVITIILDNNVLGMVRQWQTSFYGKRYMATNLDRKTDYVKLIEAFGGKGFSVNSIEELEAAMEEALKSDVPVWIHCPIGRDEKVLPMIPGGCTCDSIIME